MHHRALRTTEDSRCNEILASLPSKQQTAALVEIDFDKDLDEEMRVVNAVSNLRARNYKIPEVNLHDGRKIAGKIIPAISTTTALVSGAICMELFKVLQNKPLDQYLVSFMNLALPFFTSMEPMPPTTTTCIVKGSEWKWTQWDRIDIDCAREQVTVDGLITRLEERYGVVLQMLSSGVSILYSDFMDKKKRTARLAMGIRELVENVTKKSLPIDQKYLILEVIVADVDTDEEVEIPYVRFCLL